MRDQPIFHRALILMSGQRLKRCDAVLGDAARHDEIEVGEIDVDVEGEAVAGDPARDPDTDRSDLLRAANGPLHPRAGETGDSMRAHAEVAAGADQHLFEIAHITMDILTI